MGGARKRRSRRRIAARAGAFVERVGGAVLLRAWSLAIGGLALVAGAVEAVLAGGWDWLVRQAPVVKLGLVAAAGVGAAVVAHHLPGAMVAVVVTDETEALARVIRSEVGARDDQQRLHVAWATRNLAAERRQTIARMACTPCGPQGPERPVSTRAGATDSERALAALVLAAPILLDPTGGATHFINPTLQDELARTGSVPGYAGNGYVVVRRRWLDRYRWVPYYRLGPDLEFWGAPRPTGRRPR